MLKFFYLLMPGAWKIFVAKLSVGFPVLCCIDCDSSLCLVWIPVSASRQQA
jgi:hypothetical protein